MMKDFMCISNNKEPIYNFWLVNWRFKVSITEKTDWYTSGTVEYCPAIFEDEPTTEELIGLPPLELYLTFTMKWDGCCHINFGSKDDDGYLHFCGEESIKLHNQLLIDLFNWAESEIPMR